MKSRCLGVGLFLWLTLPACLARAEETRALPAYDPDKAKEAARLTDPDVATKAYLNSVPEERRARTKGYALGSYVLSVVEFCLSFVGLAALLGLGLSARMRDLAQRLTRFRFLQTAIYWTQFLLLASIFTFPLTWYESFYREKAYGLLTQSFPDWFADQLKGLAVAWIVGALVVTILYAVVRRTPRTWWLWGWLLMVGFILLATVIAPVFLAPLFNRFTAIEDPKLSESILAMAREQGIPADNVYQVDASRQSDRIGAYVAGQFGTLRVVLFDTLLRRCTPEQVQFVMGHEMGHYVLNHVWLGTAFFALITLAGFLFVRWTFGWAIGRWPNMKVADIADVAGLPLVILLLSTFLFFASPVVNSMSRFVESQADEFGLEASKYPDAGATAFLILGEYRDLDPDPLVEFWFYDHPSGKNRIHHAMEWKKAHPTGSRP
jgi:STE24 endopeptidase